jgi:diguanylate cyclase (GGDEF)-like protein
MKVPEEIRQVLLVGAAKDQGMLQALFLSEPLRRWQCGAAKSLEQARFLLQHQAWDALLVDESLLQSEKDPGLAWLAGDPTVPTILLSRPEPQRIAFALDSGINQWLPRNLVLEKPEILAAALHQADCQAALCRQKEHAASKVQEYRRQIDRLLGLLWETLPEGPDLPWLSQRHMLERLHQEIARTTRHGTPLALVLGDVVPAGSDLLPDLPAQLTDWMARSISTSKRREDVAGRYGPHGFMLLLPHTHEPGAVSCCRRLGQRLKQPPAGLTVEPGTTQAYFGIACYTTSSDDPRSLLSRAERRLEEARGALERPVVS